MNASQLHSTYLCSYDLFVRAYGKDPSHLLIQVSDYKELIRGTLTVASSTAAETFYRGLFVIFTTSGPPRVALL